MKINGIQHLLLSRTSNNNNIDKKAQGNACDNKSFDTNALQYTANYNMAFSGKFKPQDNNYIKAENISKEISMNPATEYLVGEDTVFYLGGNKVSLNDKQIKSIIKRLPKNGEFIIGRESTPFLNFSRTVSREHLKIRKDNKGRLFARDLCSLNGTDILPDVITPDNTKKEFTLEKGKKYLLPKASILSIGGIIFELDKSLENINYGETVTVERDKSCDIAVICATVSREHLNITKTNDGYIVKDLGSTNGTEFLCVDNT